jgi:hypothetical protein
MSSPTLKNIVTVIGRLKSHLGLKTDEELGQYFGVQRTTVSAWRARKTVNLKLIAEKCPDLNLHWLLSGEGAATKNATQDEYSELSDLIVQLRNAGMLSNEMRQAFMRAAGIMAAYRSSGDGRIDENELNDIAIRAIIFELNKLLDRLRGVETFEADRNDLPPVQP